MHRCLHRCDDGVDSSIWINITCGLHAVYLQCCTLHRVRCKRQTWWREQEGEREEEGGNCKKWKEALVRVEGKRAADGNFHFWVSLLQSPCFKWQTETQTKTPKVNNDMLYQREPTCCRRGCFSEDSCNQKSTVTGAQAELRKNCITFCKDLWAF